MKARGNAVLIEPFHEHPGVPGEPPQDREL